MRLLAFSDLHRDRDAARQIVETSNGADVVIGAGDFATHGAGLGDTLEIMQSIAAPIIVVAGNHDDLRELRDACSSHLNVHVLHGEGIEVSGVPFFGLGFEIGTIAGALPQSILSEHQASELLGTCPRGAVLVTHAPPHGVADLQRDGTHQGSHAIRACIEEMQPRFNLCGHIHNAWGMMGDIGSCRVHNLGPRPNEFDL